MTSGGEDAPTRVAGGSERGWAFAIFLIASAVFANSLANGYAYDDVHQLVDHGRIHTVSGTIDALDEPYWPGGEIGRKLGLWRPLTTLAYGLGWWAFGGSAFGFHLLNLLLHALFSVLVFRFCSRFLPPPGAIAAGIVFAVHPVHVEAVANTVGLAELLSATLGMVAVLWFLRWTDDGERISAGRITALCAVFLLALFAKEGAIVLPALLVLLDLCRSESRVVALAGYLRSRAALLGALTATAGVMFFLRWRVLGSIAAPEPPTGAEALADLPTIWTAATVWPHYIRLMVFPVDLSADYAPGVIPIRYGWDVASVVGVAVALAVLGLAWIAWTRRSPGGTGDGLVTLGILWFVVSVLPVSNLFFVSGILLAERTLYLPSLGFVLLVGWAAARIWRHAQASRGEVARPLLAPAVLFLIVVCALSVRTVTRTPVWKDNDTLFSGLMLDHPESGRSQWVIANALIEVGEVDAGLRALKRAKGLFGWPGNFVLESEAGEKLLEVGRPADAIAFLRDAIRLDSLHPDPRRLLAVAHQDIGDWEGAAEAAAGLLAVEEGDVSMHHLRASALEILGRPMEAIPHRERVLALTEAPNWLHWSWLGRAEAAAGRPGDACRSFQEAASLTSDVAQLREVDALRSALPGCS